MQADRPSAARRAPWRARVAARLRCERGDTLIEVIIAALMVALIATASLGGFSDIASIGQSQRSEGQAAALAQQDEARLRGLTISQLSSNGPGTGNTSSTTQLGGTTYRVASQSQFISGSTGAAACSGGAADEVQTTSTVTWGTNNTNGGRNPVVVHGLITPTEGGAITANVDTIAALAPGATGVGATGATITLSGPTTVTPVTVDSSGCAVFSGLDSGTYTVSYTAPAGNWTVYPGGGTTILPQTLKVTVGQTQPAKTVYLAQMGSVQASFQTTVGSTIATSGADTFSLGNSQLTTQVIGTDSSKTNNAFAATLTSPPAVLPFPSGMGNSYLYYAYAGGCTADEPTGANAPQGFTVNPGPTPTPVTIPEPALVILPYTEPASSGSYSHDDAPSSTVVYSSTSGWTNQSGLTGPYNNTQSTSSTAGQTVTVTLPLGATSATFYYTAEKSYGIATVSLSPAVPGSVTSVNESNSSSTPVYQQSKLISSSLSPTTQYTMTITVSGTKTISFDQVAGSTTTYGASTLMTTAPTVTLTDTGTGCANDEDWPPTQVPNPTWGALLYPGVPDTSYSVCVDNGTNHYTQTVSATTLNANWSASPPQATTINAYIYPGAPAPPSGTGYGTGPCT